MPLTNWLHKYPQVEALVQQEGDVLDYAADSAGKDEVEGGSLPLPPLSDELRAMFQEMAQILNTNLLRHTRSS